MQAKKAFRSAYLDKNSRKVGLLCALGGCDDFDDGGVIGSGEAKRRLDEFVAYTKAVK